jgi:hypothetical protein
MPVAASDYRINLGVNPPGTLATFNTGEAGDPYFVPKIVQEDTVTVTTGDATPGWSATVTNNGSGASETFTFSPVDVAGAASATTADAASTFVNTWNASPALLEYGRASLDSASVARLVYNDDRVSYTIAVTPAGAGAVTEVSPAIANSTVGIEVGTFAFRPTDAAITAGADPKSLVTPTGAILEQFVGGVVRSVNKGPSLDSTLTYPTYTRGQTAPVVQRGVMHMRTAVDIEVFDPVSAVVGAGAGVRDGWVTTGAGLVLTTKGVSVYRGAKAGGICQIQFTTQ